MRFSVNSCFFYLNVKISVTQHHALSLSENILNPNPGNIFIKVLLFFLKKKLVTWADLKESAGVAARSLWQYLFF